MGTYNNIHLGPECSLLTQLERLSLLGGCKSHINTYNWVLKALYKPRSLECLSVEGGGRGTYNNLHFGPEGLYLSWSVCLQGVQVSYICIYSPVFSHIYIHWVLKDLYYLLLVTCLPGVSI